MERSARSQSVRVPLTPEEERRTAVRLSDGPPLYLSGLAGAVHDVSRGGICVNLGATAQPLSAGQRLRLVLTDALDDSRQEMDAEAIWCAGRRAGLRWVSLTPEQDGWLLSRFKAWLLAPPPLH